MTRKGRSSVIPVEDIPPDVVLTSEQLFRREVAPYATRLTAEQERALVARARSGEQVRDAIFFSLQPRIHAMATRFARRAHNGTEWGDFVSEANTAILEKYKHAFGKDDPYAYLVGVSRLAMIRCLCGQKDAIKTHNTVASIPVLSLDTPIHHKQGQDESDQASLADLLSAETRLPSPARRDVRFASLYASIEALTEIQREIIKRHYGFNGASESLRSISRRFAWGSVRSAFKHKEYALHVLRETLAPSFPQYAGGVR